MTGRIFRSIVLVTVLAALLVSVLLTGALYQVYEERISRGLRTEAAYLLHLVENSPGELPRFADLDPDTRVTLIAADGTVAEKTCHLSPEQQEWLRKYEILAYSAVKKPSEQNAFFFHLPE